MKQIILVKYGEIILKGLNRHSFEDLLIKNIKAALRPNKADIWRAQATIYVDMADESVIDDAIEDLKKVFGIVAIIFASTVTANPSKLIAGTPVIIAAATAIATATTDPFFMNL